MRLLVASAASSSVWVVGTAQAQSVVSVCSGVSLPRSVVTEIIEDVNAPIVAPIESTINSLIGVTAILGVTPPLSIDLTTILANAAAGAPITLQALDVNGNIVTPADNCRVTADSYTMDTAGGISIGGNLITGLGANGQAATAGDINAIAFGNNASTTGAATGSIAIGFNASATAANSAALGAGSVADRGALTNYTALGLATPQNSVGSVSVGAAGSLRQITNVAAGTAASDAATVGQVQGALDAIGALDALAVQYDSATRDRVTFEGPAGTTLANVAPGTVSAASTEAVNGSQLFATNQQVAANTGAITTNTANIATNTANIATNAGAISALDALAVKYTDGVDGSTQRHRDVPCWCC